MRIPKGGRAHKIIINHRDTKFIEKGYAFFMRKKGENSIRKWKMTHRLQ